MTPTFFYPTVKKAREIDMHSAQRHRPPNQVLDLG